MINKISGLVFRNKLPTFFKYLNLSILLPILLWPFAFYITVFFFDSPKYFLLPIILFIAVNAYPVYLIFIAHLNALLLQKSKVGGSVLPVLIIFTIVFSIANYLAASKQIASKSIAREKEREKQGYIGYNNDFKIKSEKVYYKDTLITDADAKTFEVVSWDWQRDKNHYYRFGKMIPSIDRNSFEFLDYHYEKDKFHVFYDENIIKGADAKTFNHIDGTQDGKDKNNCYRWGEIVDCKVLKSEY